MGRNIASNNPCENSFLADFLQVVFWEYPFEISIGTEIEGHAEA
jgi:hypothetical protein